MTLRLLLFAMMISLLPVCGLGQSKVNNRYLEYIEKYSAMAEEQMSRHGIPASITLAQGLLESAAGNSRLAREGNNHFGIKCGNVWKGDTMLRDDDAVNECFRVYNSVEESYEDHSKFLKGKRYRPLFDLEPTDYAAWARGLKECGYATDPNYADRLITIIERYSLYHYDGPSRVNADTEYIIEMIRCSHPVRRYRNLHYVIAAPGDTYSTVANEYSLKTEDLLRYNDAASDGEIKPWEEVYLQEKLEVAPENMRRITIGEDESMHSISQRLGMKMSILQKLNPKAKDIEGQVLKLK